MPTTVKTGWLKDKNGDKFAPKTLTSQVQTSDGVLLEDKIQADLDAAKEDILANVSIDVDNALSSNSENPVQNKVITEKFDEVENILDELEPLIGTTDEIAPAQVKAALEAGRQVVLSGTFNFAETDMPITFSDFGILFGEIVVASYLLNDSDGALFVSIEEAENNEWRISADRLAWVADVDAAISIVTENKADKATSLAGYGITDAYTDTEIDEKINTHTHTSSDITDVDWFATTKTVGGDTIVIKEQTLTSGLWSGLQVGLQPAFEYDVYLDNVLYVCQAHYKGSSGNAMYLGNITLMDSSSKEPHNNEPFLIYWAGGSAVSGMFFDDGTLSSYPKLRVTDHANIEYNKLPEEFLPDSIQEEIDETKTYVDTEVAAIKNGTSMNSFQDTEIAVGLLTDSVSDISKDKADKADTLAGYGITDAYNKTEIDNLVLITVDDIDTICGTNIEIATASEVAF